MRRMAGKSRLQIFELEEKNRLRPLPQKPFRNLQHVRSVRVPTDYHIEYEGNFYSVPHDLIGEVVDLFQDQEGVRVLSEELDDAGVIYSL